MADENFNSNIGFDASKAFAELKKIQRAFEQYNASLVKSAKAGGEFNAEQQRLDQVLKAVATTSQLAAGQLKGLATAQRTAKNEAKALVSEFKKLGSVSFGGKGRITDVSPLAKFVASRKAANFQGKSTLTSDDLFAQQTRQAGKDAASERLAKQEAALRNVARGATAAGAALDKSSKQANNFSLSLESIVKIAATQFALGSIFQLTSEFRQATEEALQFELRLAEIQTLSREFQQRGLEGVGDTVTRISAQFGLPLEDVAKGLYETLSNQIGNAAESTKFLETSAVFATASVSSLADSVSLLSSVLNSYGLNSASAADISGKLFATIDLGRVQANELANTIGRVLPLASELGVSFDEVAASIAHLTIQGVKANEAYTLVSNVMLKLIKPTEALKEEFRRLGITEAEAGIQAFGFQGFLEKLTEASGNSASEVGELFNQIRGTRGVLGIAGQSAEEYAKTLEKIRAANAETAKSAAELITATNAKQLQIQFQEFKSVLVNDVGRSVLGVLTNLIDVIGGGKVAAVGLTAAVTALGSAATIGGIALIIKKILDLRNAALLASPAVQKLVASLGPLAVGITAGVAIAAIADAFKRATPEADKAADALGRFNAEQELVAASAQAEIDKDIKRRSGVLRTASADIQQSLAQMQIAFQEDQELATQTFESTNTRLEQLLAKRMSTLNSFIGSLQQIQSQSESKIRDIQNKTLDLKFDASQGQFERSIEGLSQQRQAEALASRATQVLKAAQEAAGKGNQDLSQRLFETATNLADRSAGISKNEGIVNQVLQARIGMNDQLIAQQKAQAAEAARLEERNQAIANAVALQISKIKDLNLLEGKEGTDSKTFQDIAAQRAKAAAEIDRLLGGVSAGKLGEVIDTAAFKTQVREIAAGVVDPVSGIATSFSASFTKQADLVFNQLTNRASKTSLDFQIRFLTATGEQFDPASGPGKLAAAFAKAAKDAETRIQNLRIAPEAQKNFNVAQEQFLLARDTAQSALQQRLNRNFGAGPDAEAKKQQIQNQNSQLISVLNQGAQAIQDRDVVALGKVNEQLASIASQFSQRFKGSPIDVKAATEIGIAFQRATEAAATLRETIPTINKAFTDTQALNIFEDSIKGLVPVTQQAVGQMQQSLNSLNTTRPQLELKQLFDTFGGQNGGTVTRAAGGPIGPDTVNGKFTPGEFVVNPRASQAFRPLLSFLNRAAMPNFQNGGDVTNVGDININISGQEASKVNGRDLAQQVRRELRKRTIRGLS